MIAIFVLNIIIVREVQVIDTNIHVKMETFVQKDLVIWFLALLDFIVNDSITLWFKQFVQQVHSAQWDQQHQRTVNLIRFAHKDPLHLPLVDSQIKIAKKVLIFRLMYANHVCLVLFAINGLIKNIQFI